MRRLLGILIALAGCKPPSSPAPSVAPTPPPASAPANTDPDAGRAATSDTAVTACVAEANAVVLARAHIRTTRDGHLGRLEIIRVLAGPALREAQFISAPFETPDPVNAVFFLVEDEPDGRRWRVLDCDGRLVHSPSIEPAVTAAVLARHVDDSWQTGLEGDLALMRRHDQSVSHPSSGPAMTAARRVFRKAVFPGQTAAQVEALLGKPGRVRDRDGAEYWTFTYHDGEQGAIVTLILRDRRVVAVFGTATE